MTGVGYRADVDGLRAVAVLAVVIYHSGLGLTGGYTGVDVFFVISGFLITRLIDRDVTHGRFSYVEFWTRRARRLIPAMTVTVLAVVGIGWLVLLPHDFRELGQSAVAQSVGLTNFYFWREAGYFAGPSEIKPLLHMWSLAVEEQFYLVMPVLMMLLYRLAGPRYITVMCSLGLVSFGWCVYQTDVARESAFYLLPSRAWELLLGGMVAGFADRWRHGRLLAEFVSTAGMAAILVSFLYFDRTTVFPGVAAALPCLGTAAVILSNSQRRTYVGAVLSLRPVVLIGLISYSLYLVHWPIFAYAAYLRTGEPSTIGSLLMIACSVCLGALSWKFVEQPVRFGEFWRQKSMVLSGAACALGCLMGLGLWLHVADGFRSRFVPAVLQFADGRADRNPQRRTHHDLPMSELRRGLPRLGCDQDSEPLLAVIGDSHGDAMMPVLHELACEFAIPAVCVTGSATLPVLFLDDSKHDEHAMFRQVVAEELESLPQLTDVMLVGRWTGYDSAEFSSSTWASTVRGMRQLGVRLWVVRQVPEPTTDVPRALALGVHWDRATEDVAMTREAWRRSRDSVDRVFAAEAEGFVRFIEPAAFFFNESDMARVEKDSRALYFDDNHLSAFGALQLESYFRPVFAEIAEGLKTGEPTGVRTTEDERDVAQQRSRPVSGAR